MMHEQFKEKVNKLKKQGYKGLINTIGQKSWEKFGRKTTKIWLEFGSVEERKRKAFWKVWKSEEQVKKPVLKKTLWTIFDQLKIRFDRSKITFDWSSINQAVIEPRKFKPSFLSQFRSIEQQVRSIENLEKSIFWKTKHSNAKTPQSTMFY